MTRDKKREKLEVEEGNIKKVTKWIEDSKLSKKDKEYNEIFVKNFPKVNFFRYTDSSIEKLQERYEITFSKSFEEQIKVLSFIHSKELVEFKFEKNHPSELFNYTGWFKMDMSSHIYHVFKEKKEEIFPFTFARAGVYELCINFKEDFNPNEILLANFETLDLEYGEPPLSEKLHYVFTSYAHMLSEIKEIKLLVGNKESIIKKEK